MLTLLSLVLAAGPTTLTIDVQPEDTVIFLDGKRKGTAKKPITVKLSPGRHIIKLQRKGESHEEEVPVKAGEKKTFKWAFEGSAPPKPPDPPPEAQAQEEAPRPEKAPAPEKKKKGKDDEPDDGDIPLDKL